MLELNRHSWTNISHYRKSVILYVALRGSVMPLLQKNIHFMLWPWYTRGLRTDFLSQPQDCSFTAITWLITPHSTQFRLWIWLTPISDCKSIRLSQWTSINNVKHFSCISPICNASHNPGSLTNSTAEIPTENDTSSSCICASIFPCQFRQFFIKVDARFWPHKINKTQDAWH